MTQETDFPSGGAAPVEVQPVSDQPKPEALSHDPLAGAAGDPNRVPSATALATVDSPATPASQAPADQTNIVVIDGHEAASTPNGAQGAFGQALPPGGEIAGGNIAKVLDPPPDTSTLNAPLTKERAALLSPIGRKLAAFIGRPPEMWGLLTAGDTVRGHMLLLDLNSGEKVRGMDGHRINEGQLFANLRNLPESLSAGDTIDKLLSD